VINLALSPEITERFCVRLYAGLIRQAQASKIDIVGGNITRATEFAITITVFGEIPNGAMRRDAAKIGDDIYVTNTVGDAVAGLQILSGKLQARGKSRAFLIDRYLNPVARLQAGQRLARLRPLPAAIDISDGLVQDLGHILKLSGTGAEIETAQLPLSEAYRAIIGDDPALALSGGDDYELLFCVRPGNSAKSLGRQLGLPVTRIGKMVRGRSVTLIAPGGSRHPANSIAGWNQLRAS
jgi:thiamine-monophosphate kinase